MVHMVNKKMRVDIESFEHWYENQTRYRKITGDPPGRQLKKDSLSPADIAELLGIPDSTAYEIIKTHGIPCFYVNHRKRVRKKDFYRWLISQDHYRLQETREQDQEATKDALSVPQVAFLLKIPREEARKIMLSEENQMNPFYRAGTTWVGRYDFMLWLKEQSGYRMRFKTIDNGIRAHRLMVLKKQRLSMRNAQKSKKMKQEERRAALETLKATEDGQVQLSAETSEGTQLLSTENGFEGNLDNPENGNPDSGLNKTQAGNLLYPSESGASRIPEINETYSCRMESDGISNNRGQERVSASLESERISVDETATVAGVSQRTILRWIGSGKLPAIKAGHSYRIRRADLENLMKGSD